MTKTIYVKNVPIGGSNKITVQSMTNTSTSDFLETSRQIERLIEAGCDIVRLAVCSDEDVAVCKRLINKFDLPLVADIQFDHRLAVKCSDVGFAKIRINPGNIGDESGIKEVVAACKANGSAIRVGVNGGSLERGLNKTGAEALAESALRQVHMLEKYGFYNTVISVKSSSVSEMIAANRILSRNCDYPLHLGVTESGDIEAGTIKSSIGIGSLLLDGIGDTIRVSLSGDPISEVYAAKNILRAIGLDRNYCEIISCPTCSRCNYDLFTTVSQIKDFTRNINKPLKVAIMGCVVNGPGEAKGADCGVAGGKDKAVLFKKGEIVDTIGTDEIVPKLKELISECLEK